jgi:hypothetical protein
VAFALAAQVIRNVMAIHVPLAGWTGVVAVATPLVGGAAVFGAMQSYFGKAVGALFGSEATFAQWNADVTKMPCLKEALDAAGTLDAHAYWGVLAVALSVVALALAAATIAFRFETDNIDGKWADSYVLRHKRYALLTLFLVASVVLVVTNIALSSYTDFAANVFGEIETSGIACFPPATADAQPELVKPRCPTTKAPATKKGGANKEKRPEPAQSAGEPPKPVAELSKPVAELFVQAKSLRKTLLNLAGGLASLTLVAMFLPAFLGLMSDIEIAGKTHAAAAAQPAAAPFNVASWKDVNAWKNDHGLSLEFSDVATALVAVAAPLLSNGVFDLSKSLLVFH